MLRDTATAKLADGSAAQRARTTTANLLGPVVVATKVCRKPRARPGTGTRRTTRSDSQCARSATAAAAARIAAPDNQLGIQSITSSACYHGVLRVPFFTSAVICGSGTSANAQPCLMLQCSIQDGRPEPSGAAASCDNVSGNDASH